MLNADRDINHLHQAMRPRVQRWVYLCAKFRLKVLITETRRSKARQFWLWCKGRVVSKSQEVAFLGYDDPAISSAPGERQVTWTLKSKHIEGLAIDFCFLKNGKAVWDGNWDAAFDIAEKCGLVSLWRKYKVDKPHLEFNPTFKP